MENGSHDNSLNTQIEKAFTYHAPTDTAIAQMAVIRDYARRLAQEIAWHVPPGRERSTALTRLEEVTFHANAGISRNSSTNTVEKA